MSKARLAHWFGRTQLCIGLLATNFFVYTGDVTVAHLVKTLGAFDLKQGEYEYRISQGTREIMGTGISYGTVMMCELSDFCSYAQKVNITVTHPDSSSGEPERVIAMSNTRITPPDDELERVELKPLPLTPSKMELVKKCWQALPDNQLDDTPSRSSKKGTLFWSKSPASPAPASE